VVFCIQTPIEIVQAVAKKTKEAVVENLPTVGTSVGGGQEKGLVRVKGDNGNEVNDVAFDPKT
jgi:hypothetical protein